MTLGLAHGKQRWVEFSRILCFTFVDEFFVSVFTLCPFRGAQGHFWLSSQELLLEGSRDHMGYWRLNPGLLYARQVLSLPDVLLLWSWFTVLIIFKPGATPDSVRSNIIIILNTTLCKAYCYFV